jgi:hypothetical protein
VLARLFLLAALCVVAAGCSMDGQVVVQFEGTSPALVTEMIKPEQSPYHVQGVTRRNGQRVGIDCAITMAFDVKEATGYAVLIQRRVTRLRTKPLRRGTPYSFDCLGPLVTELPDDASGIRASAANDAGDSTQLTVRARTPSVLVGFGRRLRAESSTQLAVVSWPTTTPAGTYHVRLAFSLPTAHPFRQRAVYTAAVSCGRSRYLQPILPTVTSLAKAPVFAIHPAAEPTTVPLPHLAPGIESQAQVSRTLACRP